MGEPVGATRRRGWTRAREPVSPFFPAEGVSMLVFCRLRSSDRVCDWPPTKEFCRSPRRPGRYSFGNCRQLRHECRDPGPVESNPQSGPDRGRRSHSTSRRGLEEGRHGRNESHSGEGDPRRFRVKTAETSKDPVPSGWREAESDIGVWPALGPRSSWGRLRGACRHTRPRRGQRDSGSRGERGSRSGTQLRKLCGASSRRRTLHLVRTLGSGNGECGCGSEGGLPDCSGGFNGPVERTASPL